MRSYTQQTDGQTIKQTSCWDSCYSFTRIFMYIVFVCARNNHVHYIHSHAIYVRNTVCNKTVRVTVGQLGRSARSVSSVGQPVRSARSVSSFGQLGRSARSVSSVGLVAPTLARAAYRDRREILVRPIFWWLLRLHVHAIQLNLPTHTHGLKSSQVKSSPCWRWPLALRETETNE